MIDTQINGRWQLRLPSHRAARPEWTTGWERERLDSMHEALVELYGAYVFERLNNPNNARRPVIVDVGAEEGDFPALFSKWGCDVVLVEPNPKVWPNIKAIWEANALRAPLKWWVGFAADFNNFDPPRNNINGQAFVADDGWPFCAGGPVIGDHGFRHLGQQADETPCITLDELCQSIKVDAITIDVEGAEMRVLRGATRILDTQRPLVWVSAHTDYEWNDIVYDGVRPDDLVAFMLNRGYRATKLADDHEQHWFFEPTA